MDAVEVDAVIAADRVDEPDEEAVIATGGGQLPTPVDRVRGDDEPTLRCGDAGHPRVGTLLQRVRPGPVEVEHERSGLVRVVGLRDGETVGPLDAVAVDRQLHVSETLRGLDRRGWGTAARARPPDLGGGGGRGGRARRGARGCGRTAGFRVRAPDDRADGDSEEQEATIRSHHPIVAYRAGQRRPAAPSRRRRRTWTGTRPMFLRFLGPRSLQV